LITRASDINCCRRQFDASLLQRKKNRRLHHIDSSGHDELYRAMKPGMSENQASAGEQGAV